MNVFWAKVIFVIFWVTVTRKEAEAFPSPDVAVMIAVPAETALTVPFLSPFEVTAATFLFEDDHLIVWFEALLGLIFASMTFETPESRVSEERLSVTSVAS